jgi:hypothetical protein
LSFFSASGIEQQCLYADRVLRNAFEEAHGRSSITPRDRRLLNASTAGRFLAINAYSRVSFARALCREVTRKLCSNSYWEHNSPVFLATLIPRGGLAETSVRGIDLSNIRQQLQTDLRGLSYIGVFEPGYYASLPESSARTGNRAISWHSHVLLWDADIKQVATLILKLRKSGHYQAVVKELKPVHARQIANGELPDVVAYLVKPPSHAYRVTRYPWFGRDGEILTNADGTQRFYVRQRKSELRKGERLRVFHAMRHLGLDELLVAGMQGSALRACVIRTAINELSR